MAAPQPHPWVQPWQGQHRHKEGGLLLASISDALRRPPPWVSQATPSGGGGTEPSAHGPMPLGHLALAPPPSSEVLRAASEASDHNTAPKQALRPGDFVMQASQPQQQQQHTSSKQGRPWLGDARGMAIDAAQNQGPLQALSRHINSEAGKALTLAGTQLLMHLANLQRGLSRQQQQRGGADEQQPQQQQWRPRFPWQRRDGERSGSSGAERSGNKANAPWQAASAARQWAAKGMAAERAMDLRTALACYTNAVALEPDNVTYLCHLAKQWSDLTYEQGADFAQIAEVNRKGVEYAERAIAIAPKLAGPRMACCVSKGRLALFSDNKTKVRLAKEAREEAVLALELEPSNDLAHHLMGRWHFEMAQLNFVVRQLVRFVYGTSLAPGTFQDALQEFGTAVALNPDKLIHRVEYGRSLLRLGHKREALRELSHSLTLDVEDINAELQKEDAVQLVERLTAELSREKGWGGFLAPMEAAKAPAAVEAAKPPAAMPAEGNNADASADSKTGP